MSNNQTISSLELEKLLEVNSKSIELSTVTHAQFEDISKELEDLKETQKEYHIIEKEKLKNIHEKIDAQNKKIEKLNIILGSNVAALVLGLIMLAIKLLVGVP